MKPPACILPLLAACLLHLSLSAAAAGEQAQPPPSNPTDIVLIGPPSESGGALRFTTLLGQFGESDMRAMAPKITWDSNSKSGLLLLKRTAQPQTFESFTTGLEQDILNDLPFDSDYPRLKTSLATTAQPELATKIARAWLATQDLHVFFHHAARLHKLSHLSPEFRQAYAEAAMSQAGTERDPYRRLCLGLVAFQTAGYAGFEAYEKDWAQASQWQQRTGQAPPHAVPVSLTTYCPSIVFTSLTPHVQADNFENLWALMRSQTGDLKAQLLSVLTLNPFVRPKSPCPASS